MWSRVSSRAWSEAQASRPLCHTYALNRATSTKVGDHLGIPPDVSFCFLPGGYEVVFFAIIDLYTYPRKVTEVCRCTRQSFLLSVRRIVGQPRNYCVALQIDSPSLDPSRRARAQLCIELQRVCGVCITCHGSDSSSEVDPF